MALHSLCCSYGCRGNVNVTRKEMDDAAKVAEVTVI